MEPISHIVFGIALIYSNIDYIAERHHISTNETMTICDVHMKKNRRFRVREGRHVQFNGHSCNEVVNEMVRVVSL